MSFSAHPELSPLIAAVLVACYLVVAYQDLRRREIDLLPLLLLAAGGALGYPVAWWLLLGVAYLWPWKTEAAVTVLIPPVFVLGIVTGQYAPTLGVVVGLTVYALRWWGAADTVLLAALAMRYGVVGLMAGSVMNTLWGLALLIARRQLHRLPPALLTTLTAQPVAVQGPGRPESEMPAATALAATGVILEILLAAGVLSPPGAGLAF